ncbi:hypothetical protein SCHPADRAFT_952887 [Schizopora paradoxa]|uniref:Zn(2)-C6 fungal-type domain-containing protein n=1 Tax=Schizopora paradoxa TaxID=27342 RepID=A0A0H2SQ95_9AGAM|nr:hypothetical protein SCHPADRAFT_952887 [Schizopora paradoxa]
MNATAGQTAPITTVLYGFPRGSQNRCKRNHQRNLKPCEGCITRKSKCVYIRHPMPDQTPLCDKCLKKGHQQCAPHIKKTRREDSTRVPAISVPNFSFNELSDALGAIGHADDDTLVNYPGAQYPLYNYGVPPVQVPGTFESVYWEYAPEQVTSSAPNPTFGTSSMYEASTAVQMAEMPVSLSYFGDPTSEVIWISPNVPK